MTIPMPEPFAGLQYNSEWDSWEQVVPSAVGQPGVASVFTQEQMEAYATAKVREAQRWHPIDSAPHETLVVLGWYDENEVFKQEIALASAGRRYPGGASDMWWHGRATHWMPLPAPPQQ